VRSKPFARLNNIIVQYAQDAETDIVGITIFGKGKMKMTIKPTMPSPSHLFTVNVLNHKNFLF
jgi:hypothetical protein